MAAWSKLWWAPELFIHGTHTHTSTCIASEELTSRMISRASKQELDDVNPFSIFDLLIWGRTGQSFWIVNQSKSIMNRLWTASSSKWMQHWLNKLWTIHEWFNAFHEPCLCFWLILVGCQDRYDSEFVCSFFLHRVMITLVLWLSLSEFISPLELRYSNWSLLPLFLDSDGDDDYNNHFQKPNRNCQWSVAAIIIIMSDDRSTIIWL